MAEQLGAQILGLGAFTSVVGDAGITIAKHLDIPVTTGNSYTVSLAVQAIRDAAKLMDIPLNEATVAVVGATGCDWSRLRGTVSGRRGTPDPDRQGREKAQKICATGSKSTARAELVTSTKI